MTSDTLLTDQFKEEREADNHKTDLIFFFLFFSIFWLLPFSENCLTRYNRTTIKKWSPTFQQTTPIKRLTLSFSWNDLRLHNSNDFLDVYEKRKHKDFNNLRRNSMWLLSFSLFPSRCSFFCVFISKSIKDSSLQWLQTSRKNFLNAPVTKISTK